jgi:hypothetical protein
MMLQTFCEQLYSPRIASCVPFDSSVHNADSQVPCLLHYVCLPHSSQLHVKKKKILSANLQTS